MVWTTAVRALGRSPWDPIRALGAGLDLTRATGLRYAWQRRREQRRWRGVPAAARNAAYEVIWRAAADALGVGFRALPDGAFELDGGGHQIRVRRSHTPIDDARALEIAGDKPRDYRLLQEAGAPVADHLAFDRSDVGPAAAFLDAAGGPCVVKPARDTGAGSGVTAGVETRDDLERAVLRASRAGPGLLIERQVDGNEYRILILDGQVLDVVWRSPPRLTGDGRSTVAQLIGAENERRLAGGPLDRLRMLTADLGAVLALRRQALTLSSRPAWGERFVVKDAVNQNSVRENETVGESLGPAIRAVVTNAARATGLRLSGIDVIAPELSGSGAEPVVLEANPHPGLHHHYAVADAAGATPVAVPILRALIDEPGDRATEGSSIR